MWEKLGEITDCNPLTIVWEGEKNMDFFGKIEKSIDYIASTNEDKKMETKYAVIMGLVCYIFKIYKEIVEKNLQNDVSGRILFRTMLETYINMKYITNNRSIFSHNFFSMIMFIIICQCIWQ